MDNYESMKSKLRSLLFGERKTYTELLPDLEGNDKEEIKQELAKFEIDAEIQDIVV